MDIIRIIGITPDGKQHEDFAAMNRFVTEINKFYNNFSWKFEFIEYKDGLGKNQNGKYSVAGLQSEMVRQVKQCLACFMVVYCKREEADELSMAGLLHNLNQQKKTDFVAYFMADNMDQIRTDISLKVAAKNEKTPIYREDRARLSAIAKQLVNQGCIFDKEQKTAQANLLFQQALVISRKLVLSEPEKYMFDLALPYHNLGSLAARSQKMPLAIECFTNAIETRKKAEELVKAGKMKVDQGLLTRERVMTAAEYSQLGNMYVGLKDMDKAAGAYQSAIDTNRILHEAENSSATRMALADAYGNLAVLHNQEDHLQEAVDNFSPMFELLQEEEAADGSEEVKKKLGMCGNSLAILYMRQAKHEDALEVLLYNYNLYNGLIAVNKDAYEPPMALVCFNLLQVLRNLKKHQESAVFARQAKEISARRKEDNATCKRIYEMLVQEAENSRNNQLNLAKQVEAKADELRAQAKYNEAADLYRQAAGLYGGLGGVENQLKMAGLYDEVAIMYWDYVQMDQAEASYKQAISIYRAVAAQDATRQADLCVALFNVGRFIEDTKDKSLNSYFKEAFEIAKKLKDVDEKAMEIYENLEDIAEDLENYQGYAEREAHRAAEVAKADAIAMKEAEAASESTEDQTVESDKEEAVTEGSDVVEETTIAEEAENKAENNDKGEKKGFFAKLFGRK